MAKRLFIIRYYTHCRSSSTNCVFVFLLLGVAGWGLACTPPLLIYQPVQVTYWPHFVKGVPRALPAHHIVVLRPLDNRRSLLVTESEVPTAVFGADIARGRLAAQTQSAGMIQSDARYPVVGFHGTLAYGNFFERPPTRFSQPDVPRVLFYMEDLTTPVQHALVAHLREAGLQATSVPFAHPSDQPPTAAPQADYTLACSIEEFSLRSLFYYVNPKGRKHYRVALGPTWAQVRLQFTFSTWPAGELVWDGKIEEQFTDPAPGETLPLYRSEEEVMNVALSRAVGSVLLTPAVQEALTRP